MAPNKSGIFIFRIQLNFFSGNDAKIGRSIRRPKRSFPQFDCIEAPALSESHQG
jgi:hypothetical protein